MLPWRGVTLPLYTNASATRQFAPASSRLKNTELNETFVWAQKLDLEFKDSSFPDVFHGLVCLSANVTSRPATKPPTATFVALIIRREILFRPDTTEGFRSTPGRFYRSDMSPFPSDPENFAPGEKLS